MSYLPQQQHLKYMTKRANQWIISYSCSFEYTQKNESFDIPICHTHTHTFIYIFQNLGYKNKKHNPQWINKKNNEVDS